MGLCHAASPIVRSALDLALDLEKEFDMNMEVKVFPYVVRFAVAYAVALVVLALVTGFLGIESGTPSSLGALIAGALVAASRFVKDQERTPDAGERRNLAFASLLASVLVSGALVFVFLVASGQLAAFAGLAGALSQLSVGAVVGIFVFVLAVYALVLWIAYGGFAKLQYKALLRAKGEI